MSNAADIRLTKIRGGYQVFAGGEYLGIVEIVRRGQRQQWKFGSQIFDRLHVLVRELAAGWLPS